MRYGCLMFAMMVLCFLVGWSDGSVEGQKSNKDPAAPHVCVVANPKNNSARHTSS